MVQELHDEDLARAKRVLSLRTMTTLSRRAFSERYGIAPGTLQHWENAVPGISIQGARRLIKALESGNIHCSLEWLMHGLGAAPRLPTPRQSGPLSQQGMLSDEEEAQAVAEELALFQEHYEDVIELVVADDGMLPCYQVGELVAGVRYYEEEINQLIEEDCIVFTKSGDLLLRQLRKSTIQAHYNLVCINPKTTVEKPILYEVELVSAAPVLWLRRHYRLSK